MRITHVIHPFASKPGSEHDIAQRVTLASIRRAAQEAKAVGVEVDVVMLAKPDYLPQLESFEKPLFISAPPLTRNVQTIKKLQPHMFLPLISDLVHAGVEHGQGDYLIYTNMDIGLQPYFYAVLPELIASRPDPSKAAFAINRRTIPKHYTEPEQLDAMYAEVGTDHPGWDCFVFPRSIVPQMQLGNACIGTSGFDSLMMLNLDVLSGYQMGTFTRTRMTFHIGDDQTWGGRPSYIQHNGWEGLRMADRLQQQLGEPIRTGSIAYEHQARIAGWLWQSSSQMSRLVNKLQRKLLLKFSVPDQQAYLGQPRTGSPERDLPPELFEKLWITQSTPSKYCVNAEPTPIGRAHALKANETATAD